MEIFSLVESNEIYFFICENALPYRKDLLRRIRPQYSLYQFRIQLYSMSSMCRNNLRKKNDYIKRATLLRGSNSTKYSAGVAFSCISFSHYGAWLQRNLPPRIFFITNSVSFNYFLSK